jgi:hypothetical protein
MFVNTTVINSNLAQLHSVHTLHIVTMHSASMSKFLACWDTNDITPYQLLQRKILINILFTFTHSLPHCTSFFFLITYQSASWFSNHCRLFYGVMMKQNTKMFCSHKKTHSNINRDVLQSILHLSCAYLITGCKYIMLCNWTKITYKPNHRVQVHHVMQLDKDNI